LCSSFVYHRCLLVPVFRIPRLRASTFYQGKIITVIQGREPGGTGDLRARAITQFLQKYIPGNPTIVHEYMGGGGLRAANHIFSAARADGLTVGSVSSGLLSSVVLGNPGVKYQVEKFHYLGAADAGGHYVFYTRKEAGIGNLEIFARLRGSESAHSQSATATTTSAVCLLTCCR